MRTQYQTAEPGCVSTRTISVETRETIPTHFRWMIRLLLVAFASPYSADAQDAATQPGYELQPVFSDDFSKDTRSDYAIAGDVSWEAGRLTLPGDASIGRAIKAGARARVDLTLELPELTPANPESELQLWFDLDGATDCFIRLRRTLTDQGLTASVALFDTGEQDGKPVTMLVREATVDNARVGRLTVDYRYGLVQVWVAEVRVLTAHIVNQNAAVASVRAAGPATRLNRISASCIPAAAELTADQQQALAKARPAEAELGQLYAQGKFSEAARLGEQVLEIRKAILGDDHPDTASSLNNLGTLYCQQGNFAAAESLFQRALTTRENSLGPDHPETAMSLNNLAMLYSEQWNYAAAEPLKLRALKICEQALGPDHSDTASILNNLAAMYWGQGNYTAAEPLFLRALKIKEKSLGPDHPDTATCLNNLAQLYQSQGNHAAAEPLALRTLQIFEKSFGPDHPSTAQCVSNLAVFQWVRDHADTAVPFAERALRIELRHLDEMAAIQTEQQQFLMAHQVDNAFGVWLTVSGADTQWTPAVYRDVLAYKGLITARQHGLRLALREDRLFADFRRVIQQLSTVSLNPPLPPSDPLALVVWNGNEPELRQAWENQKLTLQTEHERLEKELAVKSVLFRRSLEQRRVQPEDIIATLQAQDRPTALVDVLEYDYHARKEKGEKEGRRIVAFVVRGDRPVERVELGSAASIDRQVTLWRESFGGKVEDHDPGEELRRLVWLPLEPCLQGIETVLISPDGQLAQLPWGALPGKRPGSYLLEERTLAVIAVPQMLPSLVREPRRTGLPESLLLAGDIDYGGDPGQPQDLFVKRDAAGRLRDGRMAQFPKLPAATAELASIERRYRNHVDSGESSRLDSREATESAFREQATKHTWLHVITHGYFAPESIPVVPKTDPEQDRPSGLPGEPRIQGPVILPGLLSGLVFAGANSLPEADKDDGILTALEVTALDLNGTEMVVLSACETGLGAVAGGEGLLGLQRAFQVAGAKTCVASLWKVPDATTARLMQRFYENLWDRKMGKLDALRDAQLWMMQDPSARRAEDRAESSTRGAKIIEDSPGDTRLPPLHWAAFVLSGDWR